MHGLHDHLLTAASCHFSVGGMGSGTGFGNWMRKMRKMRRKMRRMKRKSIFGNVQRNCNWIWRIKGQVGMLGVVQIYSTYLTLAPALPLYQEAQAQRQSRAKEV